MEKIRRLDEKYLSYEPSERCWLDGKYIWSVLGAYQGMVQDPIEITLSEHKANISGPLCTYCMSKLDPKIVKYPLLLRVKLDIRPPKHIFSDHMRHSNLLILDFDKGEALRFEPIDDHDFTDVVDSLLEKYVEKIAPSLRYRLLEIHPQPEEDEDCPSKGMCVAYVVKAGIDVVMGREIQNISLEDIKRFSAAVEDIY